MGALYSLLFKFREPLSFKYWNPILSHYQKLLEKSEHGFLKRTKTHNTTPSLFNWIKIELAGILTEQPKMLFLLSIFLQRTIFFRKTNFKKPRENPSKGSTYMLVGSLLDLHVHKVRGKKTFFSFKTDILGRKPSSPTKE